MFFVAGGARELPIFHSALIHGCAGETKTAIFTGLSFWMTGRTCLPDQELKRLIVEHGGVVAGVCWVGVQVGRWLSPTSVMVLGVRFLQWHHFSECPSLLKIYEPRLFGHEENDFI